MDPKLIRGLHDALDYSIAALVDAGLTDNLIVMVRTAHGAIAMVLTTSEPLMNDIDERITNCRRSVVDLGEAN